MSTPLEFLYRFRDLLAGRDLICHHLGDGVRLLRSAAEHQGLRLIIAPRPTQTASLLLRHERHVPPWHIGYRTIFGCTR